jgi:S-adenosylmethionine hydrolase
VSDRVSGLERRRLARSVIALALIVSSAVSRAEEPHAKNPPMIVFMTDFGVFDDSVALCKGVMYSVFPDVRIVDLTHQVAPFSIRDGALYLEGSTPYFPAGTVFIVVIDPGVGSTRKAIVAKSRRGQYFVLPDNGLLTLIRERDGIEGAREITNPAWMIGSKVSSTFHGRDIFSPVGAHLARGDDWTEVGPELVVDRLVRLDLQLPHLDDQGLTGEVIATDGPFGNLITNVSAEEFSKLGYQIGQQDIQVKVADQAMKLPFVRTFSDVPLKKPLLFIDSRGRLSLAVNQGNFAAVYGVTPPAYLFIAKAKN